MAGQLGISGVDPALAYECIKAAHDVKRPLILWGPPGTAKSALVRQVAEDLGIGFVDLRLVQIDAVDLRGLPFKDERDGKIVMGFAPSSILPRTGEGILFLDEIAQAPTLVQNSASELLLDRKVGEYKLPDGWSVMCAANRRTDRAGTIEIPTHLKNRLIHIEVKTNLQDWIKWAATKGVAPQVIAFLKTHPKHLYDFKPDELAYPTLRTWEFASDVVKKNLVNVAARDAMLIGCLGERVALELIDYLERADGLPTYEDVIKNPDTVPMPKMEGHLVSMFEMIQNEAKFKDVKAITRFLKRAAKSPGRAQESVMVACVILEDTFSKDPDFKAFCEEMTSATAQA